MNELLVQFVIESRELVAQAADGLLQLERSPQNAECLDHVFRAFHTLKGGAGIVEFAAMERAVHAAEELLSEARTGRRNITTALVEGCLACLDQVGRWLDTVASSGGLPADADVRAEALVGRLAAIDGKDRKATPGAEVQPWVAALRARHLSRADAITAVRYAPGADCFYQGEDPVARISTLPQLSALELAPVKPWPSLSELDPYTCNLVLMALTAGSVDSARAHMQGYSGGCEIVDLTSTSDSGAAAGNISQRGREVLQSQLALLMEGDVKQFRGRLSAAGRAASNVLMSLRRDDDARTVREATEAGLAAKSAEPLRRRLERLLAPEAPMPASAATPHVPETASPTLRVDAKRIDALVRLTGELTIAKNALVHTTTRAQAEGLGLAAGLTAMTAVFERLIGELQQSVLALRVLPLRSVLQRFPRVLRDLSSTLGKPITLTIEGDHTEADKAIVEMLFEPLLHTLRNAIDHGVEEPGVRIERGKPIVASVKIRASRQRDRVVIEVEDDGAGVDIERVRRVALDRHVATEAELQGMDDAQVVDLIFAPGFSTAAAVTGISGRGVGLDAVRTAIQRVGGAVSIASRPGHGTCVRFVLPFSVMMTQVMTVEAGGQSFGIPVEALVEILRVPQAAISRVGSAQVLVHREHTIPLIDLASELRGSGAGNPDSEESIVALASVSGEIVALRVDRLGERMEIILKPLEGLLEGMRGITGTTLLGDGRVLLVLDLREMLS
jgi:two-component system, chemotaxis family, sensor kinase CheA